MVMPGNMPILRKHKLKYLGVTPSSGSDKMCVWGGGEKERMIGRKRWQR